MLMSELAHHLAVEPWSLKLNITIHTEFSLT
jgi:hypothetical protein